MYCDDYPVKRKEDLDFNSKFIEKLNSEISHLIVYGPNGSGKKTRIGIILQSIYGNAVEKVVNTQFQFATASNTKIQINVLSSNFHTEITPSDVGNNDRLVVQELIKEMASTQQVDANATKKFKGIQKVVVIHEADKLSKDAQHALRRTMEKYMKNIRLILCCNSTSRLITPIKSRCLLIRIPAPSIEDITKCLQNVATAENFKLPNELAVRIAQKSERNLRKSLLILESLHSMEKNLTLEMNIQDTDWEEYLLNVAMMILKEQTPAQLFEVRKKIYELLSHCIPAEVIVKSLTFMLLNRVDSSLCPRIIHEAAYYESRLRKGNKAIYHIEAYIAKVMRVYKEYLLEISGY